MKQKLKGGWEYDWVTSWRQFMHWNAGVGKYIKRRMNKRIRRDGKQKAKNYE